MALCAAVSLLGGCRKKAPPLLCYVGGTMRPVMEKLAKEYERQTGQKVNIDYAGSGELLIRIETSEKGDLYVCHDPFVDMLMRKGLGTQWWTAAVVTPTIVVQKGNPKNIRSVKDLARPGLKLCLTDPEYSTTGHIVPKIFAKAGVPKEIEEKAKRYRGGGSVANAVGIGDQDAGIVWDAVAHLRLDKLDAVPIPPELLPIPEVDAVTSATGRKYDIGRIKVTIATLKCSKRAEAAKRFAEFVAGKGDVFAKEFGFTPAPEEPREQSLYVHCGAGLRHAMEEVAETFSRKTGEEVQASYAGSGTQISTIKLKQQADLFMPGDVWYLEQVEKEGLVLSKKMVTYFVPVIIVSKGNPKNIKTVKDLTGEGVKLALGNPDACQIGRLTGPIFKKNAINIEDLKRDVLYSMTVNELGLWVKMGKVDASIVWDAIAANFAGDVDVVEIPAEKNEISRVAVGVLTFSRNKPLAQEFVDFLTSDEGKAIFVRHHYTVEPPK